MKQPTRKKWDQSKDKIRNAQVLAKKDKTYRVLKSKASNCYFDLLCIKYELLMNIS